ncbi:MAG: hypothetical protein WC516_06210 [Patescibacteria group bacterium]|jgi:NTP pyrophosphatase (non-canonical NTP hydrolase)
MKLSEYQNRIENFWISNDRDEIRVLLGICGESGEIAELFKKYFRDDKITYDEMKRLASKEIGDLSYYIAKLCNDLDLNWENILQENIDKLKDRQNRNVIKGSGDER